jgi:hypothetical protein
MIGFPNMRVSELVHFVADFDAAIGDASVVTLVTVAPAAAGEFGKFAAIFSVQGTVGGVLSVSVEAEDVSTLFALRAEAIVTGTSYIVDIDPKNLVSESQSADGGFKLRIRQSGDGTGTKVVGVLVGIDKRHQSDKADNGWGATNFSTSNLATGTAL